eukprot:GEMP01007607.1.p1 GENE.GEMP01007607.1~~GEMP01007607.1.p1  ORF type:complete len:891 (+),score=143.65 GEMP01007607.1:207-2879(+)
MSLQPQLLFSIMVPALQIEHTIKTHLSTRMVNKVAECVVDVMEFLKADAMDEGVEVEHDDGLGSHQLAERVRRSAEDEMKRWQVQIHAAELMRLKYQLQVTSMQEMRQSYNKELNQLRSQVHQMLIQAPEDRDPRIIQFFDPNNALWSPLPPEVYVEEAMLELREREWKLKRNISSDQTRRTQFGNPFDADTEVPDLVPQGIQAVPETMDSASQHISDVISRATLAVPLVSDATMMTDPDLAAPPTVQSLAPTPLPLVLPDMDLNLVVDPEPANQLPKVCTVDVATQSLPLEEKPFDLHQCPSPLLREAIHQAMKQIKEESSSNAGGDSLKQAHLDGDSLVEKTDGGQTRETGMAKFKRLLDLLQREEHQTAHAQISSKDFRAGSPDLDHLMLPGLPSSDLEVQLPSPQLPASPWTLHSGFPHPPSSLYSPRRRFITDFSKHARVITLAADHFSNDEIEEVREPDMSNAEQNSFGNCDLKANGHAASEGRRRGRALTVPGKNYQKIDKHTQLTQDGSGNVHSTSPRRMVLLRDPSIECISACSLDIKSPMHREWRQTAASSSDSLPKSSTHRDLKAWGRGLSVEGISLGDPETPYNQMHRSVSMKPMSETDQVLPLTRDSSLQRVYETHQSLPSAVRNSSQSIESGIDESLLACALPHKLSIEWIVTADQLVPKSPATSRDSSIKRTRTINRNGRSQTADVPLRHDLSVQRINMADDAPVNAMRRLPSVTRMDHMRGAVDLEMLPAPQNITTGEDRIMQTRNTMDADPLGARSIVNRELSALARRQRGDLQKKDADVAAKQGSSGVYFDESGRPQHNAIIRVKTMGQAPKILPLVENPQSPRKRGDVCSPRSPRRAKGIDNSLVSSPRIDNDHEFVSSPRTKRSRTTKSN